VTVEFVLLTIGAYLFGSVPAAYLAARCAHGVDIRQYGSGNVGVGNLWQMTSKRVAVPVIIFDLGKGAAMVWTAQLLGMGDVQQVVVGIATVVGHNWPVFLRFSGGRGVLTTLGVIFMLMPWGIVAFLAFCTLALILRSTPVPVLLGMAAQPVVSWLTGKPLAVTIGMMVILLIIIVRRLTPAKRDDIGPVTTRQLLFNRLFYDRDIADRGKWLHHAPDDTT